MCATTTSPDKTVDVASIEDVKENTMVKISILKNFFLDHGIEFGAKSLLVSNKMTFSDALIGCVSPTYKVLK